ncbi:glycosyltransferase family 1 protein [Methylomonas montana]|uniref:glycosyltransferase family 4 protein n=1 Tax=Methylomonas montana TaxID=3058963 RepID=UPI002659AAA4|nr:glycosyltransferase family 1 protein [Methylomonas montana]WKJ92034.1 glycosyltransferase family 1 protein [Methylomonas montana]
MFAVDTKTFSLYGGGIAHFFAPLLQAWARSSSGPLLTMIGPNFDRKNFAIPKWLCQYEVVWPDYLPRSCRHPYYDNVQFPGVIRALQPKAVFSPYHDVRLPKHIPSVMTVHDLCLDELPQAYPLKIRAYYLAMLRFNLKRAHFLLTVSEFTKQAIIDRYRWPEDRIAVIYNTISSEFSRNHYNAVSPIAWRKKFSFDAPLLLYTAGIEYRKNIPRLLVALDELNSADKNAPMLLVTGYQNQQWQTLLATVSKRLRKKVWFLGYLSLEELRVAYESVDAVVFPSLGEGFGRACLESMACGTPIACSDLPVFREVAADYPTYFDPKSIESIVVGIHGALNTGRKTSVIDSRFDLLSVQSKFLNIMHEVFP